MRKEILHKMLTNTKKDYVELHSNYRYIKLGFRKTDRKRRDRNF